MARLTHSLMVSILGASIAFAGACWLQAGVSYEYQGATVTVSTNPLYELGE